MLEISDLTKQFTKKNIPDIRSGDTIRVSYKITEGNKTRIQAFEGLCIALKHGRGLDGSIKIRKISGGLGVERTFPLHSPLIVKFEKVKSSRTRKAKLYFVRDLTVKQRRQKTNETKDYGMWEESASEEELAKIEAEKAKEAEAKAAEKAKKEEELEEKFEQAVEAHGEEKKEENSK